MNRILLLLCTLIPTAALAAETLEIYVSDAGHFSEPPWQILKFDGNGENPEVFINEELDWPQDILFLEDQGSVLVSNLNSGRINRYDAETGAYTGIFAEDIRGPTRMKIGADGLLYVLQWSGNGRVLRYELDGSSRGYFTVVGVEQSIGLDWDAAGRLYVSSYGGGYVRRFDPNGADLGNFIATDLDGPTNVWFDSNGDLLVADWDGGAIKRFGPDGVYKGVFIGDLGSPEGVAHLPDGDLLIGDSIAGVVRRYTPAGLFVENFIPRGAGGLLAPNAVVVRLAGAFGINAGMADAWYSPTTNGQGFLIAVFPDAGQLFAAWFTYDTERPPANVTAQLGEPGHRWLTAQGPYDGDTADLTLNLTSGGVFDAATPPAITAPAPYGTLKLEFSDCSNALATYNIPSLNRSGQIPLQRIVEDNAALCDSLTQ